jgi:VWFA-related protein
MRLRDSLPLHSILAAALCVCALPVRAQLNGTNKPAGGGSDVTTISVYTRLVIETVTVKDKAGKPIDGLTAKDFTITEDGVPQKISFAEHQNLPETATPMGPVTAGKEDIKIFNRLGNTQIASEAPGEVRYKDHRLLALYFDMAGMPPTDQLRALLAAQKFIRENMTDADLVSIMRYAGSSVDILQDFTGDRNRILSILETLVVGEGQGDMATEDSSTAADTGAAFGQDDGEFNIFTTDRQLSALQTAAEALSHLNEKKELIYFASGMVLSGMDNQAQLHATIDSAIRSGVSFWPIDARGLVATGPLGDATHGSQGGAGMYTGAAQTGMSSRFNQSQDTLYALAGDTGGKALLDNNDLGKGIIDAQHAESNYYILGYYTTNLTLNGKFRKIKVTVLPPTEDAKLDYTQGYYAGKEWGKYNTADKERQLEDALMQQDPWTELTVAVEVNYFQLNKAEYQLPVMVKIPGSELVLAKKRGAEQASIDFVGEIKDDYGGTTVTNIRDHVDFKVSDKTAEELAKRPIYSSSFYTLLPGKYSIKVLVRDDATGHIGTFQSSFVVPNLNKETKRVAISSVVLSGQRTAMSDAIYNATKGKEAAKDAAADPLVQNGVKLIPSVTRVFSKTRNMYVYLQAYEAPIAAPAAASTPAAGAPVATPVSAPAATGPAPLLAFVSFYQGTTKVYETQPEEVLPHLTPSKLQMAPLSFTVDLNPLPPGKYDCQVTVLDPTGQKTAFWQAPIAVVQ